MPKSGKFHAKSPLYKLLTSGRVGRKTEGNKLHLQCNAWPTSTRVTKTRNNKIFQNIKILKSRNISGEKWLSQGEIDALAFNRQPVPVVSQHIGPYNLFNFSIAWNIFIWKCIGTEMVAHNSCCHDCVYHFLLYVVTTAVWLSTVALSIEEGGCPWEIIMQCIFFLALKNGSENIKDMTLLAKGKHPMYLSGSIS